MKYEIVLIIYFRYISLVSFTLNHNVSVHGRHSKYIDLRVSDVVTAWKLLGTDYVGEEDMFYGSSHGPCVIRGVFTYIF